MQGPRTNARRVGGNDLSLDALGVLDSVVLRCSQYAEPSPSVAANLAFVTQRRQDLQAIDERIAELRSSPLVADLP